MITNFKSIIAGAVLGAAALLGVAATTITVPTQAPKGPQVYPLMTVSGTNLATLGIYTNQSVTFPIFAGRGFRFNAAANATNSSTVAVPYLLQFATINNYGGTLVTNWGNVHTLTLSLTLAGTTKQYLSTNIAAALVDNYAIGRLFTATNAHTSSIQLDSTNTYVTVFP